MDVNNKFVVYTSLFGDYDDLKTPGGTYKNCDFVCFTDQETLKSNYWKIILIKDGKNSPLLLSRKFKLLPHLCFSHYDVSLYVDANIKIVGDPHELAGKYLSNYSFVAPKHFSRNCIYDEANICIADNKADIVTVQGLMNKYMADGFPSNYGLMENNILLRKHNDPEVIELMEQWWNIFQKGPKRDQLSLMYVCWRNGFNLGEMDESSRNSNKYFKYCLHKSIKKLPIRKQLTWYINGNRNRNFMFTLLYQIILTIDRLKIKLCHY